jgi:hypothetical protein
VLAPFLRPSPYLTALRPVSTLSPGSGLRCQQRPRRPRRHWCTLWRRLALAILSSCAIQCLSLFCCNNLRSYAGCFARPFCNNSALSSAAFFGTLSSSSPPSINWSPVINSAAPAPLYGACVASPWPHAAFEPDPSYSQLGAAIMAGGITLAAAFVPPLPLTVFPFDSSTALASVMGAATSSRPQLRAFSACSLMGISDYFIM